MTATAATPPATRPRTAARGAGRESRVSRAGAMLVMAVFTFYFLIGICQGG